jgi:hypothetical protein
MTAIHSPPSPQRDWLHLGPTTFPAPEPEARPPPQRRTIQAVLKAVAEFCGVSVCDLKSDLKMQNLVGPRHLAYFLARGLTTAPTTRIAAAIGDRDHTTIIHGSRKTAALIEAGKIDRADVLTIMRGLMEPEDAEARLDQMIVAYGAPRENTRRPVVYP